MKMNADVVTGNARKKMSDTAVARSQVYGLLTTAFRAEPNAAFVKDLKGPRFSGASFAFWGPFPERGGGPVSPVLKSVALALCGHVYAFSARGQARKCNAAIADKLSSEGHLQVLEAIPPRCRP